MTLIDDLDLRPYHIILQMEEEAFQAARLANHNRKLDEMWDWPAVPIYVPAPRRRHIEVTITADTSEFTRALNTAQMRVEDIYNISRLVTESLWGEHVQGGQLLWKPHGRWNLSENWPTYSLVVGLTFIVGFLSGAWPWQ